MKILVYNSVIFCMILLINSQVDLENFMEIATYLDDVHQLRASFYLQSAFTNFSASEVSYILRVIKKLLSHPVSAAILDLVGDGVLDRMRYAQQYNETDKVDELKERINKAVTSEDLVQVKVLVDKFRNKAYIKQLNDYMVKQQLQETRKYF